MARLRSQNVLVTGADGFIGSHLAEQLVAAGARVRALSQYNSFNYLGWLEDLLCLKEVEAVIGDIRDPHFCYQLIQGNDVVFHVALGDPQRVRPARSEVLRLRCDNAKLKNTCGFVPTVSLRDGLERRVRWFTDPENLRRYKRDLNNV